MENDIRAMLDRAAKIRRCECIVHDEWDTRLMRDFCNSFDINDDTARIRNAFDEDGFRFRADSGLDVGRVGGVCPINFPAELLEGMAELVDRAAIKLTGSHKTVAR